MLTKEEALLAAGVAEKYPPGLPVSAWGRSRVFLLEDMLGQPAIVANYIADHPRVAGYG